MTKHLSLTMTAWLGLSPAAIAAVLTVGSGGTYATVQEAVDDAMATVENDELRLRAATFFEEIATSDSDLGGRLEISGGWDASFTARDPDPGATVLDGSSSGRVLTIDFVDAGELVLRGLTFRNGLAGALSAYGGGLYLFASDIPVTVEACRFESNLATIDEGVPGASGGGALVLAVGSAEVELLNVTFTGNEVFIDDTIGAPQGGAVRLSANDTARIVMRHGSASGNVLDGGSQRRGGGISAAVFDSATIEIEDFVVTDNHGDTTDSGEVRAHGVDLSVAASGTLTACRLTIIDNWNGSGDLSPQLRLALSGGSVEISDTLVARGGTGIFAEVSTATLHLTNLTATEHESSGIRVAANAPASATVTNSIAWDNDGGNIVLLGGAATGSFNLAGVDPLFVDPGADDYRLAVLSPAIGAGTASPPGGLGPFDLAHAPRIVGSLPDQGALERDGLLADDFESGDAAAWAAPLP